MKPDEMIAKVEAMRGGGAQWGLVADVIGSSSGPAAMKRYQRAKKIGPYSKPRKRKPTTFRVSVNSDPNAAIKKALKEAFNRATEEERLAARKANQTLKALLALEGKTLNV